MKNQYFSTQTRPTKPSTPFIVLDIRYVLEPTSIQQMPFSLSSLFGTKHQDPPRILATLKYFYERTVLANKKFVQKGIEELAEDESFPGPSIAITRSDIKILQKLGLLIIHPGRGGGRKNQISINTSAISQQVCSVA